jgi:hypothetical protein
LHWQHRPLSASPNLCLDCLPLHRCLAKCRCSLTRGAVAFEFAFTQATLCLLTWRLSCSPSISGRSLLTTDSSTCRRWTWSAVGGSQAALKIPFQWLLRVPEPWAGSVKDGLLQPSCLYGSVSVLAVAAASMSLPCSTHSGPSMADLAAFAAQFRVRSCAWAAYWFALALLQVCTLPDCRFRVLTLPLNLRCLWLSQRRFH